MPELPEVESARQMVEQLCGGHTITRVVAVEQGGGSRHGLFDELVFEDSNLNNNNENTIKEVLQGKTLNRVNRKGKQMWFEFRNPGSPAVLFHFGMTGSFSVKDHDIPTYKSFRVDAQQWPPRFTKLLLEFSNGKEVAFSDSRRLGRIRVRQNPLDTPPISSLGVDPLHGDIPDAATIQQMLSPISAPIKSVLLDQERLFCGIGNYLADEILYQSRIHPSTRASALTVEHISSMVAAMKSVLQIAVAANADYKDFPSDWLFHVRWDKVKSKSQRIVMPDGSAVVFEEVAGRTTAIVPSLQILHRAVSSSSNTISPGESGSAAATSSSGSGTKKEKIRVAVEVAAAGAKSKGNVVKLEHQHTTAEVSVIEAEQQQAVSKGTKRKRVVKLEEEQQSQEYTQEYARKRVTRSTRSSTITAAL